MSFKHHIDCRCWGSGLIYADECMGCLYCIDSDHEYECTHALKLHIDDQLDDPDQPFRHTPKGFKGAKNGYEAKEFVKEFGPPQVLSLDCDLGIGTDGKKDRVISFLMWLEENYHDHCPESWTIHSQNSVAKPAVESFLNSK